MEVCPSTSFLSRSSALPIHWQSDFRLHRKKTTKSVKCFCRKKLDLGIEVVDPTVMETLLRGTRGISNIPWSAAQTVLSTTGEKSMPSKKESTSMVACVEEDRVRWTRSHCVLRHLTFERTRGQIKCKTSRTAPGSSPVSIQMGR